MISVMSGDQAGSCSRYRHLPITGNQSPIPETHRKVDRETGLREATLRPPHLHCVLPPSAYTLIVINNMYFFKDANFRAGEVA